MSLHLDRIDLAAAIEMGENPYLTGPYAATHDELTLRDVDGWTSEEVRNALEITETNQRVLLHRARSKVRAAIERYLNAMEPTT